jgi:hypothetical protein
LNGNSIPLKILLEHALAPIETLFQRSTPVKTGLINIHEKNKLK